MAIESAVMFRRAARIACLVLFTGLLAGGAADAQLPISAPAPVTVGSVIPFSHGGTGVWKQIYSIKVAPTGNIVFLDSPGSIIYQIAPGASSPSAIVGPAPTNGHSNCSDLEPSGSYWNAAIAFDQWDNMYVTDRYGSAVQFCRVPYSPSSQTWNFTSADIWANPPSYTNSSGQLTPIPPQDLQVGDDGTFYVSTSDTESIFSFKVDQNGNVTKVTPIATGLKDMVSNLAIDHAGDVFFIENAYDSPTNRVTGMLEIPAGSAPLVGDGSGKVESTLTRLDPPSDGFNGINGIYFDKHGNLYWSSQNNIGYGGQATGLFMTPNEGTPTSPKLVWADTTMVSPVGAGFPILIDPRGFIWIPTGGNGNWAAPYDTAPTCDTTATVQVQATTCLESSMVLWRPGSLSIGASPSGTPGTAQPLFYMFSQPTTGSFKVAAPATSSFVRSADPIYNTTTTPSVPPCTDGQAYPAFSGVMTNVAQYSWCEYWTALNASTAGNVSGEVQILDASNNIISGSDAYVNGVGQAPAVSVLSSPVVQAIGSGLNTPLQVAADSLGNTYVVDSGLKYVEKYAVGSTSSTTGKQLGSNFTSPTGVAVDGAGDLYIGDSGSIYEIPYINSSLQQAQQTAIATGLGNHLNLAADGSGDVFVADKDKKQVVEISNPQTQLLLQGMNLPTLALSGPTSGWTSPTAVATDSSGDLWVADGSNLWELTTPYDAPTEVLAGGLQAPVTGLAVDPSGSVFVAGATGVVWIPYNPATGSLNLNGAVQVTSGLGSSNTSLPIGVALDSQQNLYATFGSGTGTAGLAQLGISGTLNFNNYGEINPNVPFEADAQIYNLGNTSLAVSDSSTSDVISGASASLYSVGGATQNSPACSSTTNVAPGSSCYLGLVITATAAGQDNASIAVASNAANATSGLNIAMAANVVNDLRPGSAVAISLTPASGIVYPGSITVKVSVTSQNSTYGTPSGSVILSVSSPNGSLPRQTAPLDANGNASFSFSNLLGGTYTVNALYGGAGTAGGTQNTCVPAGNTCWAGNAKSTTFTVAQAIPSFVVGQPGNTACLKETTSATDVCTPNVDIVTVWAGNTYLQAGKAAFLTTTVSSTVGTPSGTVTFEVNGKPADPSQGVNGALPLTAITLADSNNTVVQGAIFNTENLMPGVYNLTAVYSGDVNYATETVNVARIYVIEPSIQITASGTVSITAGTPAQATLTLMPLVGFTGEVQMECNAADAPVQLPVTNPPTTLPPYTQCTFAYPQTATGTISVGNAVPSTIVVTINTNIPLNGGTASLARQEPWSLAGLFGLGLLGLIAGRKRLSRYMAVICVAIMLSGLFVGITACTNAGYSTPPPAPKVTTPSGTYNVQIITYYENSLTQSSLSNPVFTLPVTVQ